jgi:nucleoid-associated protein YgaU
MPVDKEDSDRLRAGGQTPGRDPYAPKGSPQKVKAEHTVAEGETLSDLALKYYGSADKDKWMAIYEANKGVIGDNPNIIVPGQVLKIPEL